MPSRPRPRPGLPRSALAESTAQGQFILSGNVHDRLPVGGSLVNLGGFIEKELLAGFQVIFSFDLGNGLRVTRGAELLEGWSGAKRLEPTDAPAFGRDRAGGASCATAPICGRWAQGSSRCMSPACCAMPTTSCRRPAAASYEGSAAWRARDVVPARRRSATCPSSALIIADNLNDLHPSVALNPRAAAGEGAAAGYRHADACYLRSCCRRDKGAAFDHGHESDDGSMARER